MQELNDTDLEQVNGGAWSLPNMPSTPSSSSAGTSVNATASGSHAASTDAHSQSVTMTFPGGESASFSLGFGAAYGY
jgi:bacteriocin-like protein